jgi:diguanylate cyclase (GGDEF)-like protein
MAFVDGSPSGGNVGRSRWGFAAVTLILLGALTAVAIQLSQAQMDSRDSALRRFTERAEISAALTQSVFSALGNASGEQLQRRFGGSRKDIAVALARQLPKSRLRYMAVIDAKGRVIAVAGRPPRRLVTTARKQGGPILSNVLTAGGARYVQYTIPFGPRNARRALAQGVPLETMASWVLRLEADRARVLGGINRGHTLPWVLLASLALAAAAGLGLFARLARSAGRQREANVALHESREQLSNLVDALEEAVLLHHDDGRTELLNASAKRILDTEVDALEGLAPGWKVLDSDGLPLAEGDAPIRRVLATASACSAVVGLERPDGSRRWLAVRARPLIRPGEDRPHAVVASCTDVSHQREAELRLIDLAQRDPLTGLWNRRRFEEDVAQQLARCRRYGERAALLVLDLDGFKQVNDSFGHLAGDEVLCALGQGLSRSLRASDSAARIGGDEFAALLVDVDSDEARDVATEVAARLTQFARDELDAHMELSLSVGVAVLDGDAGGVIDVLAAADREMYGDKRQPNRTRPGDDDFVTGAVPTIGNGSANHDQDARFTSLRALVTAVQARDSYTATHSRQVVMLARAVARRLLLDDEQVIEVEGTALLHDLGKIAVPDAILQKPGPLTEPELVLMRQHPIVGAQMVSSIPELEHLAPAIRAEHERWDGAGFPDGLAGETIPLSSRIVFVCDAYHAMTSERPYRRALPHEAAIVEIATESGRQFCPAATDALLTVLRAEADRPDVAKTGTALTLPLGQSL